MLLHRFWSAACAGVLIWLAAVQLEAAPQVTNLSVRGLQLGATTTVVIDGQDLAPAPDILLPIDAEIVIKGTTDKRIEAAIKLPVGISPGIYPLRVCNGKGVSSPVLIGVDALSQKPFAENVKDLPAALHGRISGNQILRTTFQGKKGQRIVLDVEAKRLGSLLDAVVRLYDPRGAQIAWSPPRSIVGGDARCEAVLESDGPHAIELHDRLYKAKPASFFRLKIGDVHYADAAFPLAVATGETSSLTLVSSSLPLDTSLKMTPPPGRSAAALDMSGVAKFTGPQPAVIVSQFPELLENSTDDGKPQVLPAAPVAVSGRISAKDQQDVYHVPVREGAKIRIDVLADRAGSALDGVLSVKRAAGQQLAQSDDRPGTSDPGVEVTVPKGETMLAISLRDLRGDGGPDSFYRLLIEPADAALPSVSIGGDAVTVPAGGTQVVQVQAKRNGTRGAIRLNVEGLPKGVTVSDAEVAGGDAIGLISLTADDQEAECAVARITAQAGDDKSKQVAVMVGKTDANRRQPWLREEVAIAVAPAAPVRLAWSGDSDAQTMWLGSSLPLSISVDRREGAEGKLRLRLLTTQTAPKKSVTQGRQKVNVDDPERTLRLEKDAELDAEALQADVRLLVPNDLPERPMRVALVGELLAGDGKTVLATAATPVRRLVVRRAIELTVVGEAKIEAVAGDEGETGVLKGAIKRSQGISGPVTLTLAGLPKGYEAPTFELSGDVSEFEFPVRFATGAKPGELKGVRLLATTRTRQDDDSSAAKSNEVPITLTVVGG